MKPKISKFHIALIISAIFLVSFIFILIVTQIFNPLAETSTENEIIEIEASSLSSETESSDSTTNIDPNFDVLTPEKAQNTPLGSNNDANSLDQNNWIANFEDYAKQLGYPVGIAVAPIGGNNAQSAGTLQTQVAWSTSKVPVAIAAIKNSSNPQRLNGLIQSAITASDNGSAQALYDTLGTTTQAKTKIEAVLAQGKNPDISVPTTRLRSGFTIFGQTKWSISDQAIFVANLRCIPNTEVVYQRMGEVIGSQRWGLGQLPNAHFKGGWGPVNGGYLVRQMGIVQVDGQEMGVAIITLAPSFGQGTETLTQIANWLKRNGKSYSHVPGC